MTISDWLSWLISADPKFWPSLSFNKRNSSFSLYFYLDKDSYVQKILDFDVYIGADGSNVEGVVGSNVANADADVTSNNVSGIIASFFSLNDTLIKKAIHSKKKRKVSIPPKVAFIKKHILNISQVRRSKLDSIALIKQAHFSDPDMIELVSRAASSFDFSFFIPWFSLIPFPISQNVAFSVFRNLVVDLQH